MSKVVLLSSPQLFLTETLLNSSKPLSPTRLISCSRTLLSEFQRLLKAKETSRGVDGGSGHSQSYLAKLFPEDNLNPESASRLLDEIMPEVSRVLKPTAHFYVFFSWDIFEALKLSLLSNGLEFQPYPLIWDKGKATGAFNGYNYPSSFEPVLFGWKPPRTRRLSGATRNVILQPPLGHNRNHPFEKPTKLLELSPLKDQRLSELSVLDPFAGSGSTICAATKLWT